jgi:hypothetical protein
MGEAEKLIDEAFSNPDKRPITRYAATPGWREYFAESLVAYFVEPEALLKHDPPGDLISFLAPYAKGEWIRELRAEEESQARSAA